MTKALECAMFFAESNSSFVLRHSLVIGISSLVIFLRRQFLARVVKLDERRLPPAADGAGVDLEQLGDLLLLPAVVEDEAHDLALFGRQRLDGLVKRRPKLQIV